MSSAAPAVVSPAALASNTMDELMKVVGLLSKITNGADNGAGDSACSRDPTTPTTLADLAKALQDIDINALKNISLGTYILCDTI